MSRSFRRNLTLELCSGSRAGRSVLAIAAFSLLGGAGCGDSKESPADPQAEETRTGTQSPSSAENGASSGNERSAAAAAPDCSSSLPNTQSGVIERSANNPACITRCAAGFADCDGDASNGCESSLSSPEACGRCADACLLDLCSASPSCRRSDTVAPAWAAPSPGPLHLAADAAGVVTIYSAERWNVEGDYARVIEGAPAVQTSNRDKTIGWATDGWVGSALALTPSFIYVAGTERIQKLTREGQVVWTREMPPDADLQVLEGRFLLVDAAENLYLLGQNRNALDFDGQRIAQGITNRGFLLALSADNVVRWAKGGFSGLPQTGAILGNRLYRGDSKALVALDTATGEEVASYEDAPDIYTTIARATPDGALIVSGSGFPGYHPASGRRPMLVANGASVSPGASIGFVARFDAELREIWRTSLDSEPTSLAVAPNGEIYAVVTRVRNLTPQPCVLRLTAQGAQNGMLCFDDDIRMGEVLFPAGAAADARLLLTFGSEGPVSIKTTLEAGKEWAFWGELTSFPELLGN